MAWAITSGTFFSVRQSLAVSAEAQLLPLRMEELTPGMRSDPVSVEEDAASAPMTAVSHAAQLLVVAGWLHPKGDMFAPPAVYLALLVLYTWIRQGGTGNVSSSPLVGSETQPFFDSTGEVTRLVAQLMAPRSTAAPHAGPQGMFPVEARPATTPAPRQVLQLGLQWMANAGASGYAQRLARMLDREEGQS